MKITRKDLNRLIESFLLKEEAKNWDKGKPTLEEIKAALRQGGFGMDDNSAIIEVNIDHFFPGDTFTGTSKRGLMVILWDGPKEKKLLDWCRAKDRSPSSKTNRDRIHSIRGTYTQSIQDQAYKYLKGKFGGKKVELVDVDRLSHLKHEAPPPNPLKRSTWKKYRRSDTPKDHGPYPIDAGTMAGREAYTIDFIKKQNRNRTRAPFEKVTREFLHANVGELPKELKRIAKEADSSIKAKKFVVVIPSVDSAGQSAGKGIANFKK